MIFSEKTEKIKMSQCIICYSNNFCQNIGCCKSCVLCLECMIRLDTIRRYSCPICAQNFADQLKTAREEQHQLFLICERYNNKYKDYHVDYVFEQRKENVKY